MRPEGASNRATRACPRRGNSSRAKAGRSRVASWHGTGDQDRPIAVVHDLRGGRTEEAVETRVAVRSQDHEIAIERLRLAADRVPGRPDVHVDTLDLDPRMP